MALTKEQRQTIYRNLVDATCGPYKYGDLTTEQQAEAIRVLHGRLANYKSNENAHEEHGPLQPAFMLSQIAKVPVEVIEAICETIGLELPTEINVDDEEIDYEIAFAPEIEGFTGDDFFKDADVHIDAQGPIAFVRKLLGRMEAGEIHSISIAAIDQEGEAQLWVPETLEDERIEELFSPIIDALVDEPAKKGN